MDDEHKNFRLNTVTNTELLDGLRSTGNRIVWQQFVDRYRPMVERYAMRMGLVAADAQDAAQQTLIAFCSAYQEGKYDREQGRLRGWLFGIARNQIRNMGRKNVRKGKQVVDETNATAFFDRVPDEQDQEQVWDEEWRQGVLRECLQEIRRSVDEKSVTAFELFAWQGWSANEVAEHLDMTPNAVFIAKHRILRRIREMQSEMEDVWQHPTDDEPPVTDPPMDACPTKEELSQYVTGKCAAPVSQRIETHLSHCSACIERCIELDHEDELVSDVRQVLESDSASRPTVIETPPAEDHSPEDEVEGFRIQSELGRGGMGAVYLAEQRSTRRLVALKVLLQGRFASEVAKKRFEREVELAALLDHPNIVTVLESGISRGRHYFAMKYVEGLELDLFVSHRKLDVRDTLKLFAGVTRAISYAHQRGILHRDLKPSNILVDEAGEPHILDFGLAKVSDPDMDRERSDRYLSTPGQPIGTLPYMSPEQTTGMQHELDVRSDVYSLGLILYRLLTGKHPYRVTGDVYEVLRHINTTVPKKPSTFKPALDDDVDTIVLKALDKDRQRRYQSADALAEDVERFLSGHPILAKRDSAGYVLRKLIARHKPVVATGAVIVVLFSIATVATLLGRAANIRAESRAILAGMVDDPGNATRQLAQTSPSVRAHAVEQVSWLVTSPSYSDRVTGGRAGLILNPEAFWQSVDGGPLWENGEWLELCDAPELVTPDVIRNLTSVLDEGSPRQQYVSACLIGCLADRADAETANACADQAANATHPGVSRASAWCARQLGHAETSDASPGLFSDTVSGLQFVRLPSTSGFRRGSGPEDRFRLDDETPPVSATPIAAIYMGTAEVNQQLYARFLEDVLPGSDYQRQWKKISASTVSLSSTTDTRAHASGMISLAQSRALCTWLNHLGTSAEPPRTYRLPTEDEWEYAARATSARRFCFGNDPKYVHHFANCNGGQSWHLVARRMPNWFGLHDMHGGMWEWTTSPYPPELGAKQGIVGQELFVYRGGAYYSPSVRCRSAQRNFGDANTASDYSGVRLVMELQTQ